MVYIYNPFLLDLEVSETNTKNDFTFADIYCRESTKKMQENAEKGYRRIPLVTVKTFAENRDASTMTVEDLENIPTYISSYKKENKNGKLNITARITECKEEAKSDIGFIAAIPIRGYINAIQFDTDIEPLKIVLKYVDKFEFNGEKYTQVIYVVGRASKKISNLLGNMAFESCYISNGDVVTTYRTEVIFQNEDIRQETNIVKTETGEDAVKNAKEITKDFTTTANSIVELFAKEFKPNNGNHKNFKSNKNNYSHGGFKGGLVIPEYQGNEREKNSRSKKKRRK